MMRRDPELADACRGGDLVLADGMSVVWALRGRGHPGAGAGHRVRPHGPPARGRRPPGGLSAYFLGAREEVVRALAERCARDVTRDSRWPGRATATSARRTTRPSSRRSAPPGPTSSSWGCPPRSRRSSASGIARASTCRSSWAWEGASTCSPGTCAARRRCCVSVGMEWSWRLLMEPRKMWKRYLTTNTEFLWVASGEILGRRVGGPASS